MFVCFFFLSDHKFGGAIISATVSFDPSLLTASGVSPSDWRNTVFSLRDNSIEKTENIDYAIHHDQIQWTLFMQNLAELKQTGTEVEKIMEKVTILLRDNLFTYCFI